MIFAHLARPARGRRLPGVLVIHENRGLNEHIRDVTRRTARAGFVGLGIDLLSRFGGTPGIRKRPPGYTNRPRRRGGCQIC